MTPSQNQRASEPAQALRNCKTAFIGVGIASALVNVLRAAVQKSSTVAAA